MKTPVTCICGHTVETDEIVQMGAYLRLVRPNLVFIRFRCSVCDHCGEKLFEQSRWHEKLQDIACEETDVVPEENGEFRDMGPIDADEQIDFHIAINGLEGILL